MLLEVFDKLRAEVACGYFVINIDFGSLLVRCDGKENFVKAGERLVSYYTCFNLAAGGPKFGCDFVKEGKCQHRSLEVDERNFYREDFCD